MPNVRSTERFSTSTVRYAVPFLLVLTSLLVRLTFQRWLGVSVPYLHFFPSVMIAAWFGGLGPGVVATLLSAAVAIYFFLAPHSFIAVSRADAITVPVFVALGIVISWLFESVRRSEAPSGMPRLWPISAREPKRSSKRCLTVSTSTGRYYARERCGAACSGLGR
jgi:K+-sensing histidine kinase KdpD